MLTPRRAHNGIYVISGRRAAVVLLQGYIIRGRPPRARSLSTGMPHLARVQSDPKNQCRPPRRRRRLHNESYRTLYYTHVTHTNGRSRLPRALAAAGQTSFRAERRRRRERSRRWQREWERVRARACVKRRRNHAAPPATGGPCHRQITRLVCSPRYRKRPRRRNRINQTTSGRAPPPPRRAHTSVRITLGRARAHALTHRRRQRFE